MTRPEGGGGVPEDPAGSGAPGAEELGVAPEPPVPHGSMSVQPLPDPQDLERAATAQRNKDALAQLGRTVADVTTSAADATGTAARAAAARAADTAGGVRDQVAERVADVAERAAGPEPVGDGVVVAGPGLPAGTGSRTFRAADLPADAVIVEPGPEASSVALPPAGSAPRSGSVAGLPDSARETADRAARAARDASSRATAAAGDASSRATGAARDAGQGAAAAAREAGDRATAAAGQGSDRAAAAARQAGDRAAVLGQQAVVTGRAAVDQGSQAAAAGQEVAARAQQAGQAAQQAGAAAQEAGAAALAQTRTAVSGAVASGVSAVRQRTAAPIDLEGLAADVLALSGVARLAPDAVGRGRGLLPGQVAGAQVTADDVTVRVVARYGVRLPQLAERVHHVARRYADGRQTVVEIVDLDLDDPSSPNDSDQRGTS